MSIRKYREISIEAPDDSDEAPFPVIEGMRAWKNKKNEFVVLACHYTADPEKRSDEWYQKATAGLEKIRLSENMRLISSLRPEPRHFLS